MLNTQYSITTQQLRYLIQAVAETSLRQQYAPREQEVPQEFINTLVELGILTPVITEDN